MTLVLIGKDLVLEGSRLKNKVQKGSRYILYIYFHNFTYIHMTPKFKDPFHRDLSSLDRFVQVVLRVLPYFVASTACDRSFGEGIKGSCTSTKGYLITIVGIS